MKNRQYSTILYIFLIAFITTSLACSSGNNAVTGAIAWQPDVYTAFKASSQEDKPVLLYLNADWCGYCRKMEAETFSDPEVGKELGDAFIWVKLNGDKDPDGQRFKQKFNVRGYPAIYLLDSEENELDYVAGYLPTDLFLETMTSMRDGDTFASLQERVDQDPGDLEARHKLARKLLFRGQPGESLKNLEQVLKSDPDNKQGQLEPALYLMAQATYSMRQYRPTLAVIDKYSEKFPEGEHTADFMLLRAQLDIENNQEESARATLEKFLERFPDHSKAEIVRQHLESY